MCHNFRHGLRRQQAVRVLCATFGVLRARLWHQFEELGTGHLAQHARWHRVRLVVVVDVDVQPIHHIEVGICEELFHRSISHLGHHATLHERLKVRLWRELLRVFKGGQRLRRVVLWCGRPCAARGRGRHLAWRGRRIQRLIQRGRRG